MATFSRVLAVSACGVLFAVTSARARANRFLFGVENTNSHFKLAPAGVTPAGDYWAHHSSSAFAAEWSYKNNVKARASFGTLASTLEEVDVSSDGAEGFFYASVAVGLETRLEAGGGLLLDMSYTIGRLKFEKIPDDMEYNHDLTSFVVAYSAGNPDKARFYAGVGYSTYKLEILKNGSLDKEFQENQRFSIVGGVRARSKTFSGLIEGRIGLGEIGLRVGVMFGF